MQSMKYVAATTSASPYGGFSTRNIEGSSASAHSLQALSNVLGGGSGNEDGSGLGLEHGAGTSAGSSAEEESMGRKGQDEASQGSNVVMNATQHLWKFNGDYFYLCLFRFILVPMLIYSHYFYVCIVLPSQESLFMNIL